MGLKQVDVTQKQTEIAGRQADIAGRQADILAHQVEVERATLRAGLFERRLAVYKACQAYAREALHSRDQLDSGGVAEELGRQLEVAQFLFAGSVRLQLLQVTEDADRLADARGTLEDLKAVGNSDQVSVQAKIVRELRSDLRIKLLNLSDVLGEEMKLYIPRSVESSPN